MMNLMSWMKFEYFKSEASKLILKGDIAVIKTGDDHPYYLLKLRKDLYETQEIITDSYNHKSPLYHRVIQGNYQELHKEQKDSDLYNVDYHKTAMISAFAVIGNCPVPEIINVKKNGKLVAMYVISSDIIRHCVNMFVLMIIKIVSLELLFTACS